jgi:prepilin-type N-terminal cleavage/methylation domain-containing protein
VIRLLRRLRSDSGFTLVEMVMVLFLLGIVMAFTLNSMASYERAATGGIRRLENLDEARTLMEVISKDIRTAAKLTVTGSPFLPDPAQPTTYVLADDNSVTFYANLNLGGSTTCPKKVHLYVNANKEIIEEVTEPNDFALPPCTNAWTIKLPRPRLVGQYVANAADEPVFTYYYDNGGVLTAFPTSATPLTTANGALVSSVGIELAIRKDTSLWVSPTTLVNRVRLPNVYYNPPPSPTP